MDAYNLLDESYTTIGVKFFNDDEEIREGSRTYNYKVPKDWQLTVGDLIIVPATRTLRIVKVTEVHDEPQFNGFPNLKWAVQRIDMQAHEALQAREQKFRDMLVRVERQRTKDELVASLRNMAGTSDEARRMLDDAMASIAPPLYEQPISRFTTDAEPAVDHPSPPPAAPITPEF